MYYCPKCRTVSSEGARACSSCGSRRLRPVKDSDFVYLQRADEYTAQNLGQLFQEYGIRYEILPYGKGRVSSLYDMEVMPTDKAVYVSYDQMESARALIASQDTLPESEWADDTDDDGKTDVRGLIMACAGAIVFILFMMAMAWLVAGIGS